MASASQDSRDYAETIARALATLGGHLAIGRGGFSLHYDHGWLSGYDCDRVKLQAIAAGLPVIDSRAVEFDSLWRLAVGGPMVAVGCSPSEPPYSSLSYAPLTVVAEAYRAAGAEVFNIPGEPRNTPNPASFDEVFRQIGRSQVGGGPKTTPADELLFCGNLGSGTLFLTSLVRLIEPNESFYTPSNMRLRDSFVGRSGHWVDIEVRGECSDADFVLIQRLAAEADTRPVRLRRAGHRR